MKSVSIIIPAYNEESVLENTVEAIISILKAKILILRLL